MNIVIIEDEDRTARQLERLLKKYDPSVQILVQLPSIKTAVAWFNQNAKPDLVFMDIHLEDGLVFSVFEQIQLTVPVIFTTAYDEYMLKAFKVNSIDYLLKPIEFDELTAAIEKFKNLRNQQVTPDLSALLALIQKPKVPAFKERFMINIGTKIHSIEATNIGYFYSEEKGTFLMTKTGQLLPFEQSLDQMMPLLNPDHFFRVNRQFIIARTAIHAIHAYSAGKLKLDLLPVSRHEVFVSTRRLAEFKDWLGK
ncbi:LytTR family DNA-binding domain-containing protein [Dyadobacter sp. CY356]|uniref:LytR/AlgR family response regulator transcription factor n=1 Tax=Dyadobacter sp. CY356 TaxID=2906442 RepID=UPI001F2CA743|nr:LytTR family DNA-binding domain-containing protein [Dyadobacter sp. CY356]MCF0055379.1 LytTR family DNA-binding domain-containing protein [Dyadobacter sp. CY356]